MSRTENMDGNRNIDSTKKKKFNQTQAALSHFKFLKETADKKKKYECTHCGEERDGTKQSNLVSHLKSHPEVYANLCNDIDSIERKRRKLLLDCVQMVTVDGRSFSHIYDSSVLSMNEQVLNELRNAGRPVNLTDPHLAEVKDLLMEIARSTREKVSTEVKNRALSLMVDIVTKRGRSILGFSVQYVLNGKHTVRSIGMIELYESHTGIYLADVIVKRLKEFCIELHQVITITTDNGANVLKMIRDVECHLHKAIIETQNSTNETAVDEEIQIFLTLIGDESDDDVIEMIVERNYDEPTDETFEQHSTLLDAISTNLENEYGIVAWDVKGINCAAHTLQLAIKDCLNATVKSVQNLIILCRKVAIFLRLETTKHQLNALNIKMKKPRLDVKTRWGSLFLMVCTIFVNSEIQSLCSIV